MRSDAGASVILRARMSLLLGYYADMLFVDHGDAFKVTVGFLFESMGYGGAEHAVALQSIDTMNTVVSDNELSPRLYPMIDDIVTALVNLIGRVDKPTFFEFIRDFTKYFAKVLDDKILLIFKHIVDRIMHE